MLPVRKTVLVVEDEPFMRELEAELLEEAGYDVELAEEGLAAIETLSRRRPDLVILDIVMPGIDGWAVLRHIATLSNAPAVIVTTGQAEFVPPNTLGRLVAGHLLKPFRGDALLKMCRDVLAVPAMSPPSGTRKERRRTYVVEATLLSPAGSPLVTGQLLQLSVGGFRLAAVGRVQPGHTVYVRFPIPGRDHAMELRGTVRWRAGGLMGIETKGLRPDDQDILRRIVDSDGEGSNGTPHTHAPARAGQSAACLVA
jgi:two-component system OmpR family response regulator